MKRSLIIPTTDTRYIPYLQRFLHPTEVHTAGMYRYVSLPTPFPPAMAADECPPSSTCLGVFGYEVVLDYQSWVYLGLGLLLLALLLYTLWPRPSPPPRTPTSELEAVECEIEKGCADVAGTTTGVLTFSLFLSVLRPDPTPAVTLFGFYGLAALDL